MKDRCPLLCPGQEINRRGEQQSKLRTANPWLALIIAHSKRKHPVLTVRNAFHKLHNPSDNHPHPRRESGAQRESHQMLAHGVVFFYHILSAVQSCIILLFYTGTRRQITASVSQQDVPNVA